jgi:hypothetical protein
MTVKMKMFTKLALTGAIAAGLAGVSTIPMLAQNAEHTAQQRTAAQQESPSISSPVDGATHPWTTEQLITSSVHEAWLLSGRNEDQFFEMVKELSAVSAKKRGVTLPEDQAAGVKAGAWIKKESKKDPDQLLYAVVDKAVMKVGIKSTTASK